MDQSPIFARHFSRLVWLMINESRSVDEQKMSLRALVQVSKTSDVSLAAENWELRAGDETVPSALTGVQDLTSRMAAHSIRAVQVDTGATAADLLGLARILASDATQNDGGDQVTQKLAALGAARIRITTIPAVAGRPSVTVSESITAAEPIRAAEPVTAPAPLAPPAPPPPAAAPKVNGAQLSASAKAILAELVGKDVTTLPPEQLFAALDAATQDADASTKVLDDLVTLAEHSARIGKPKVVADILHGIVSRGNSGSDDVKRAFVMAVRRLSKPALLRAVAGLVVKHPERKQSCYEVLRATGEDGAEALIEQIAQARSTEERESLHEVMGELPEAVPALIRMLGDSRWFVVRNAADLLGEMAAKPAESALVGLLRHNDDRVRRSATNALLKVGTPDAVKGVYDAVGDTSPEVRMQAAASLSTRKDGKTAATLIRAIEGEADPDVQLAMIAALGKVATPEAVQKLVKMSEPEGRLFRKKSAVLRIAAAQALGEARTPAAIAALKELVDDKEREVRDTATRALAQAVR